MNHLVIRKRVHLARDEKTSIGEFVLCPEEQRWVPVAACRRCGKQTAIDDATVSCTPAKGPPASRLPEDAGISEVMDSTVLCVDSDAVVESALRALEEHDAPIAVVVDADQHAIGVCSRRDLAYQSPSRRVETCMTPFLITMLEAATVADAIELVERGLGHIPVLGDGRVVGVVTPRAVIRWLAQNLRAARRRRGQGAKGCADPR
jgi:CBS domain-containing protein